MSIQAEFAAILKMNPMFANLGAGELEGISGLCDIKEFGTGEVLFRCGDRVEALFGIRRGQVRIETGVADSGLRTLSFLGPGELRRSRRARRARPQVGCDRGPADR